MNANCFEMTKTRVLVLIVAIMLSYAGVIAIRGNVSGKNMLLWGLLSLVLFSFGYCIDGSCDDKMEEGFDGGCASCTIGIEGMHGGKHSSGGNHHTNEHKPKSTTMKLDGNAVKPADGKHHSTAVPMKLDSDAVKHAKPAHHQKRHQKHKPASQNGVSGTSGASGDDSGVKPTGKLEDDKQKNAVQHNQRMERQGVAMPSQSGLMELESTPVTININYNNEIDSDNIEKNSRNKSLQVGEVMREIGKRNIYPGGAELLESCDGDNCIDNRTYNGYCNKGAYQLAQMQKEILNLRRKYSDLAYLNSNPYMPLNEANKKCSVCPVEANGQFASFEGLKGMAEDQPTVNPMMPGVVNRFITRGGNNYPVEDYIP